jgi:hypothetical protein
MAHPRNIRLGKGLAVRGEERIDREHEERFENRGNAGGRAAMEEEDGGPDMAEKNLAHRKNLETGIGNVPIILREQRRI